MTDTNVDNTTPNGQENQVNSTQTQNNNVPEEKPQENQTNQNDNVPEQKPQENQANNQNANITDEKTQENQTNPNNTVPEGKPIETQNEDGPKDGGKGFKEKTDNALHNTEGCMNEVLNTTDEKVGKPVVGFTEKIGASFKKWFKL